MDNFAANPLFKNRWSDGFRIGMLDGSTPQQQLGSLDVLNQIRNSPGFKELPESVQNTALTAGVIGTLNKPQFSLPELEAFREREARRAQELGKESLRETLKAKMFYDLPDRITRAFALPGQIAMEGANRIAATTMEGVRALPQPQVAARPYAYTPTSYF